MRLVGVFNVCEQTNVSNPQKNIMYNGKVWLRTRHDIRAFEPDSIRQARMVQGVWCRRQAIVRSAVRRHMQLDHGTCELSTVAMQFMCLLSLE
jgi:hypothetical protein